MENQKLCPFNGMKPCVGVHCAMYDMDRCELAAPTYDIIDAVLCDGEYMNKLTEKIADALAPALEEILKAIVER